MIRKVTSNASKWLLLCHRHLLFLMVYLPASQAFLSSIPPTFSFINSRLFVSTQQGARDNLLDVAKKLADENGIFLKDADAKAELDRAAEELETIFDQREADTYASTFLGDWDLVCTTSSAGIPISPLASVAAALPSFLSPLERIREALQQSVNVQQRIRSRNEDGTIDRVDNVIEFEPRNKLEDIFGADTPESFRDVDINPLDVSKAKVALIHKATVDSVIPSLKTSLALESIVLSVAGTSQYLDPLGADVLGLNVPLGEFLNSGSFETTYMDEGIRISRGKVGPIEQLRVFTKAEAVSLLSTESEEMNADTMMTSDAPVEPVADENTTNASEENVSDMDEATDDESDFST